MDDIDLGKNGPTMSDVISMARDCSMAPHDAVPRDYDEMLGRLLKFSHVVCDWQREIDVRICGDVSAMMATRLCPDWAAGGTAAANHCANFITLGYVIKD